MNVGQTLILGVTDFLRHDNGIVVCRKMFFILKHLRISVMMISVMISTVQLIQIVK